MKFRFIAPIPGVMNNSVTEQHYKELQSINLITTKKNRNASEFRSYNIIRSPESEKKTVANDIETSSSHIHLPNSLSPTVNKNHGIRSEQYFEWNRSSGPSLKNQVHTSANEVFDNTICIPKYGPAPQQRQRM